MFRQLMLILIINAKTNARFFKLMKKNSKKVLKFIIKNTHTQTRARIWAMLVHHNKVYEWYQQ